MDLGSKLVHDFKAQTKLETTTPQEDHTLQIIQGTQEGLKIDKATKKPHHNFRKHALKAQKTETPQSRYHQIHRIQKKLARTSSRGHHIQKKKEITTHRV